MANFGVMQSWIALLVQAELTNDQIGTLINLSDLEECEDYQWERLKAQTSINSFARLPFPSVSVTQGSATVVSNGAMFPPVTNQFVLVVSGQTFAPLPVVANALSSTTLTLTTPYPAVSNPIASASLFPLWYSVPGFQQVFGVAQQIDLVQTTHEQLNLYDPARQEYASPAYNWAPGGRDINDYAQIELWPIETAANAYIVYGLRGHIDMVNATDLPAVPSNVVTAKAAMKACESIYALRGDQRWLSMMQKYQSDYEEARDRARLADAEQFGQISTIQDTRGEIQPDFAQIAFRDGPLG